MQSDLMFLCSGEFSGVGVHIEELTGRFWDSVFQPLLNKVSQGGQSGAREERPPPGREILNVLASDLSW